MPHSLVNRSKVKEEILPVQTRCLRLKNLFPSATVTRPVIYQFHSVKFDGVFFSSLDIIVSFSNIGYSLPKRRPTEVQTVPQTPTNAPPTANKSFWSWMVKKLSWNFSNKESVYTTITTRKETYGIKDFPIEMLRIENTIDHLIQLQSMLNQVVYEFKLTYTDQCMTEGYIYEFVHAALFGQENTSFTQQRGIGVELKQDIYTQITAMVKTFLKVAQVLFMCMCILALMRLDLLPQ